MDEEYELALATEGQSATAFSEDQWIAWEEQLALAPGLDAKRALINGPFGVAADYAYRAPLLTLLQVQELLDADESEEDGRADALLTSERATIRQCVEELKTRGCNKKADRLSHRLAVMELEVARRVGKSEAVIKDLSNKLATEMGLAFVDAAPGNIEVDFGIRAPLKTRLEHTDIDTEHKVYQKLMLLETCVTESSLKSCARNILHDMDLYARELLFARVIDYRPLWDASGVQRSSWMGQLDSSPPPDVLNLSVESRWWVLDVILDEFAFEYAEVEGFLDVIIADMRRDRIEKRCFGSRLAHSRLSLSQLNTLLESESELFRSDAAFVLRFIYLLRASHESDEVSTLEVPTCRSRRIALANEYLTALQMFSASANPIRAAVLFTLLSDLKHDTSQCLKSRFFEYIQLPRFGSHFVNPDYLVQVQVDELVLFSTPTHELKISPIAQQKTQLSVNEAARILTDTRIDSSTDFELIKSVLYELWSTGQMTADDDEALYKYLKQDFVDAHKAESMIVSGRGDLATWKDKLPRKGAELSDWSSTTEISFCESNPTHFMPEDDLSIFVHVRNVKSLTVQVYEVRTVDYYARKRHEVQGDICLDGLLPNEEHVVDLSHLAPWQKARVPIKLSSPSQSQAQSQSPTTGRRGVFVVEVYEKDVTCRAVLRQGHLRHVERVTSRGHEFTVLSERGEVIKDASLMVMNVKSGRSKAQPPRVFEASGDTGVIVVPFRQPGESSEDQFCVVLRHDDFGCFVRQFEYLEASFTLDALVYVDSEQRRPGAKATLLVHPLLLVGSGSKKTVSLDRLLDVNVSTSFQSANTGARVSSGQNVVQSFASMQEVMRGKCVVSIPLDAEAFTVNISARVRMNDEHQDVDTLPTVSSSTTLSVMRMSLFDRTFTAHFSRRQIGVSESAFPQFEYYIAVLGHNGEPVRAKRMRVSLQHVHYKTAVTFDMQSDDNGEIVLGSLNEVREVRARFTRDGITGRERIWDLPNVQNHYTARAMNHLINKPVHVPIPFAFSPNVMSWMAQNLISVCRRYESKDAPVMEDVTRFSNLTAVTNGRGHATGVSFSVSEPGEYMLYVRPLDVKQVMTISNPPPVLPSPPMTRFLVHRQRIVEAPVSRPLTIMDIDIQTRSDIGKKALTVSLVGANPASTVVWAVIRRFLEQSPNRLDSAVMPITEASVQQQNVSTPTNEFSIRKCEYLDKRKISDEHTYILQRRAFVEAHSGDVLLTGVSSLPKPTLIQNPRVLDSTEMEDLTMRDGEDVTGFVRADDEVEDDDAKTERRRQQVRYASRRNSRRKGSPESTVSSTLFLTWSSIAVALPTVNASESTTVFLGDNLHCMECPCEIIVLARDTCNGQWASREIHMTVEHLGQRVKYQKRDARLSPIEFLAASEHLMQAQHHKVIRADETIVLPRAFLAKASLFETLGSAVNLWSSCSAYSDTVAKIKGWWQLATPEKIVSYTVDASDELNVFLYKKDPVFFKSYVKPLVAAKMCKTISDLYVLEDDATIQSRYLNPRVFSELGTVEKLLVAERSPEHAEVLCRHVIDYIDAAHKLSSLRSLNDMFERILSHSSVAVLSDECTGTQATLIQSGSSRMTMVKENIDRSNRRRYMQNDFAYSLSTTHGGPPAAKSSIVAQSKEDDETEHNDNEDISSSEEKDCQEDFEMIDIDADPEDESKATRKREARKRRAQPYVLPGKVRHVQEKRSAYQCVGVDDQNMFWRDYALHLIQRVRTSNAKLPFVSSHFPEALRSFTEGLLAISVLDLPFEVIEPTVVTQVAGGRHVQLEAKADVVLYHQGIGVGPVTQYPNSVLTIKQRLITQEDRSSVASSDFSELRPVREFVVGRIYSCVVNVSNISSKRLKNVNLLLQIPRGSIPLTDSGFYTKNEIIEVAPHDTNTYAFEFYFPEVGSFTQYPAHAALDGEVIAWATTDTQFTDPISVVLKASTVDLTSWRDVAARGSLEDVLAFMTRERTLHTLDVNVLAWRCRDAVFYFGLVPYLRERWVFYESIWKYAFMHSDMQGMRELCLSKSDLVRKLGHGVRTEIVRLEDVYRYERFDTSFRFDHTEFGPLLSRRAHRVSGQVSSGGLFSSGTEVSAATSDNEPPRVLHKKAREYYRTLCHVLSHRATLTAEQLVVMSYFLILFNRIADAIEVFERAKELSAMEMRDHGDAVESSVVADYIDSYLDFFRPRENDVGDAGSQTFPVARRNVAKYSQLLHDRWQQRFSRLHEVLDEFDDLHAASQAKVQAGVLAGGAKATSDGKVVPDDGEVRLDARVNSSQVLLESQNLGACEISFYRVDVELMFSSEPFDSFSESAASKSSLLLIKPWHQVRVALSEAGDALHSQSQVASEGGSVVNSTAFELPAELAAQPMLLRIREVEATRRVASVAPPIDLTRCYFNSQLQVVVTKQAGLLQVLHRGLPVTSCYVKVFAKTGDANGGRSAKAEFYKDGYTDVIGKFDYAAVNGDLLSRVEKFSVLVAHPTLGTSVHQVLPPVLAVTSGEFKDKQVQEALWF